MRSAATQEMPYLCAGSCEPQTSIAACRKNPKAMSLWAALIVGAMLCGFVTLFFGLVIAFPIIGHATWHAFRNLVQRGDGS